MATSTLEHPDYEAWVDNLWLHCCEGLALTYAQWCAACRGEG